MSAVGNTDDERIVLEFLDAWQGQDVDQMLSFFAPDAVIGRSSKDAVGVCAFAWRAATARGSRRWRSGARGRAVT